MLTKSLLRTRVRKDQVIPSLIDPLDKSLIAFGEGLLELFRSGRSVGATRGELELSVKEMVGVSQDHKLLNGIAKVLFGRCEFEVTAPIEPKIIREVVFRLSHQHGPLASNEDRFGRTTAATIFQLAAQELSISEASLEAALFADRKDQAQITSVRCESPEWLLQRYNVSLVQSVLLRARELTVNLIDPTAGRVRQLLRYTKFYQLIHTASRKEKVLTLTLDGPASILLQSTRYGMQLATFLPALLLQDGEWRLEAELSWGKANRRKRLNLDSTLGLRSHYRDQGAAPSREAQWFKERFDALETDWTMREGESPIDLGGRAVMMPDFTFNHDGRTAHLEIIGYWRKEYLRRRVALLNSYGPGNLILAVSTGLQACKEALDAFEGEVITFKNIIPAKRVIEAIERVATAKEAR